MEAGLQSTLASSEISFETFGKTTADLNLIDRTHPSSNFGVLKNLCADVIVGQMFLRQHSSVTFMMNGYKEALTIATSAESPDAGNPAVAAADLEPPRLFEFLLPACKPIAAPSRRYSSEDTKFIRSEVQRLLDADIIEPVRSPWRTQVHSPWITQDAYPLPNMEDLVIRIAREKCFSSIELRLEYHQVPLLAEERHYTAFEADGQLFQYKRLPSGVTNGVSAFQRSIDKFIKRHRLKKVYAYLDDLTVTGETLEEHYKNLKRVLDAAVECNLTINEEKLISHN